MCILRKQIIKLINLHAAWNFISFEPFLCKLENKIFDISRNVYFLYHILLSNTLQNNKKIK